MARGVPRDPTSFFDAAPLTPSECQMLSDIGKAAFSKLLETTRFIRRLAAQEGGEMNKHTYGATINITGNLEEIAHFCVRIVSSGDSAAHRKIAAQLYCLENTARLHTIEAPTSLSPFHYTGLRWSHIKSPMRMLLRDRDFCTVEYLDEYIDENGKRGFAMCSHSVSHSSCPALTLSNNYVRASVLNSGYVFTETDSPSVLRVTIYFDYGAPGKMAQARLLQSLTKRRVKRMEEVQTLLGTNTADASHHHRTIPADHDACAICNRTFKGLSLFNRKVQCKLCDQIVCKRCSDEDKAGYMRDRVCHSCLRDMHPAFGGATRRAPFETSSAMSIANYSHHSYSQVESALDTQRTPRHIRDTAAPLSTTPHSMTGTSFNFNRSLHVPVKASSASIDMDDPSRVGRAASVDRNRADSNRVRTPSMEQRSIFERPDDATGSMRGMAAMRRRPTDPRTPRQLVGEHHVVTPKSSSLAMRPTDQQQHTPKSIATTMRPTMENRPTKSDSLCDLSYLHDVMRSTESPQSTKSRVSNRSSNQSGRSTSSAKSNASGRSNTSVRSSTAAPPMSDLSYLSNFKQ
ncbi:Aste57867_19928 [Aphanomyces stellatus]|uniref:Aste57867_19928 protein n=1 Tax=Aphanomyces stellatus TaxID=120398 RepID=A0A485LDN4_9STRA|nr:hypothetical protein As57867_019862 [Aphanomyces stellatus]VFT96626.1 Aste57867_19928 [Aphanomyces stellatus]